MKLYIYFIFLAGLLNITPTRAMDDFSPEFQALFRAIGTIERKERESFVQERHSLSHILPPLHARKKISFYMGKKVSSSKKGTHLSKQKRIACPHCTKIFSNNSHRNRHIATAHIKSRFWCDRQDCKKSFPRLDTLKEHKFQVHDSNEDRFFCTIDGCTRNFGCKSTLVKHLRGRHDLIMAPGTSEYLRLTQCMFRMSDESSESPSN